MPGWNSMVGGISDAYNAFTQGGKQALDFILDLPNTIPRVWEKIGKWCSTEWDKFVAANSVFWGGVWTGIKNFCNNAWMFGKTLVKDVRDKIFGWGRDLFLPVRSWVTVNWRYLYWISMAVIGCGIAWNNRQWVPAARVADRMEWQIKHLLKPPRRVGVF
jgi:hypothetical protein